MRVLITGISGVGKTSVLAELQKRGFVVIDLDATGICIWRSKNTKETVQYGPSGQNLEWLNNHEWYCGPEDTTKLLSCIREDKHVFVAALPQNMSEILHLFDKAFILTAPEELIRKRLVERTNNHFAKKKEEQDYIFKSMHEILGQIPLFTRVESLFPEKTADEILSSLEGKHPIKL